MNLKERIEKIENKEKESNEKKFKFPFGKKVGTGQRRKGYVTLVKLYTNGNADFKKVKIEDSTFFEDEVPRLAQAGCVFFYKKTPIIFLPEWNIEPFTPFSAKTDFKEAMENGTFTNGIRLLLNKMELAGTKQKKQMSGLIKWIFILGVGAIIVYAFLSGSI